MNYDQIAAMKVDELRKTFRELRITYNLNTNSRVSAKEVKHAPKARLLYYVCRYWVELDAKTKYDRMFEELQHREEVISRQVAEEIKQERKRTFLVTMEELINETNKDHS